MVLRRHFDFLLMIGVLGAWPYGCGDADEGDERCNDTDVCVGGGTGGESGDGSGGTDSGGTSGRGGTSSGGTSSGTSGSGSGGEDGGGAGSGGGTADASVTFFESIVCVNGKIALSGDGAIIVGLNIWARLNSTEGGGLPYGNSSASYPLAVDGTGDFVVGSLDDGENVATWRGQIRNLRLPVLSSDYSGGTATGVSADGERIVGTLIDISSSAPLAFSYTVAGGLELLDDGDELNTLPTTATAISADGTTIVGQLDGEPYHLTVGDSAGMQVFEAEVRSGAPFAVSEDGSFIVGHMRAVELESEVNAFRFEPATGTLDMLAPPEVAQRSEAHAVSADGTRVAGVWTDLAVPRAFVWDESRGERLLVDELAAHGVPLPLAENLSDVTAMSADGTVLAGCSHPDDASTPSHAFVVTLPR